MNNIRFQQNVATCHTSHATIDLLHQTFDGRFIHRHGHLNWPLKSFDLTPLDYFLWSAVKEMFWFQQNGATCHTSHATIDLLHQTFDGRLFHRNGDLNWSTFSSSPGTTWNLL